MAKQKKAAMELNTDPGAPVAEGAAAPAEKKQRKAPQPKELPDETLYLTDKFTESSTVFGAIRQFVADKGGSALRSEITAGVIATFKPKKSQMDLTSYVKSYMRDVVKLRFLSKEDLGIKTLPAKVEKPKKETTKDANGLSELGKKLLAAISAELTEGEVAAGTSTVTLEGLAATFGKNQQTLRMSLKSLVSKNLATYSKVEDKEFVVLTKAGWDLAHAPAAESAAA